MSRIKVYKLPVPFERYEVDVVPVHFHGEAEKRGDSVSVMDRLNGQGHRYSIEFAEAQALTVLKAIRAYRRAEKRVQQRGEAAS